MELICWILFLYLIAIAINFLKLIGLAIGGVIEYVWDLYDRFKEKHNATQSISELKPTQSISEAKTVHQVWRNDDIINKVLNDLIPPTENQK